MLQYLEQFNPIRLPQLKERANLMRRTDNKYVLTKQHLKLFLQNQTACFDILCIDGLKQFQYSSAYLDSPKFDKFLEHNKDCWWRFKLRYSIVLKSIFYYIYAI